MELRLDDEPCEEGELPGSDGMPPGDEDAVGIDGADDEEDEDELGIDGIDEEDDEELGLGIDGAEEEEEEEDGELGIDGMPLLLELCWVDSQPARISASAEAPIKATTRWERR